MFIFTRHISNELNTNLGLQGQLSMWDKVIPLGINALGGEEMTTSISHRTTADLKIYRRRSAGTMTNLLDGDYVYSTSDLVVLEDSSST